MMTMEQELIELTRKLLSTIAARDWESYAQLCDPSITCFEPEARGHLVAGLEFHRFYFELGGTRTPKQNTLVSPHVRILGNDAGVVSYVRLVQVIDANGSPQTVQCEESRVWEKRDGRWRHVHFHRSNNA